MLSREFTYKELKPVFRSGKRFSCSQFTYKVLGGGSKQI
jgi:hypothetical protein